MHCPARTSASFGMEATSRPRLGGPELKKPGRPQCYSMMRDVRKEFVGSYSTLKERQDCTRAGESSTQVQPVDPNIHGMKWMKEHQHSYRVVQLDFWLLLRPLTDSGEESSRQLAHRLLSMSHWSCVIEPPTYHTHINEHQLLAAREQWGGQKAIIDRGLRMCFTMQGLGLRGLEMDLRERDKGPQSHQIS